MNFFINEFSLFLLQKSKKLNCTLINVTSSTGTFAGSRKASEMTFRDPRKGSTLSDEKRMIDRPLGTGVERGSSL
jgi:hypothetical protein